VDVQLDDVAFTDPSACHAENIAAGGTELKLIGHDEQKIVVVLPHGNGSEIALVSVKPGAVGIAGWEVAGPAMP